MKLARTEPWASAHGPLLDFVEYGSDSGLNQASFGGLILAWGKVEVKIWTHKINGLSESDFILAAKIDHAYQG